MCAAHGLPVRAGPPPRVFDLFLFNDEVELLEIRLHELRGAVDAFILVEGNATFSGQPKPKVFERVRGQPRFLPFQGQLVHHVYSGPRHLGTTAAALAGAELRSREHMVAACAQAPRHTLGC